jgi:hypothetical protein
MPQLESPGNPGSRSLLRSWYPRALLLDLLTSARGRGTARALCEHLRYEVLLARAVKPDLRARDEALLAAADHEKGSSAAELTTLIRRLGPRWFFVRDVHAKANTVLLQPRWALSYFRGPMTLADIRRATVRASRSSG